MGACLNKEAKSNTDITHLSKVCGHSSNSENSLSIGQTPLSQSDFEEKYVSTKLTKDINKQINKKMKELEKKDNKIVKLLLLGSGSSGKSTLFRQVECIHGEDQQDLIQKPNKNPLFLDCDITNYKKNIRLNCIDGLIKLLKQSDVLSTKPYNKIECIVNINDPKISTAIKTVIDLKTKLFAFSDEKISDNVDAELAVAGESMQLLWELDGVKETFKNRQYFSLPENMDYFLDKISVIMDESADKMYTPSLEDILNARIKTTGIIERTYFIKKTTFNMFDVGGQRNERKKWIQLFDNVQAVIFVAALNHYCSVLVEDERINSMQESLQLFEQTVNLKWFSANNTQWILFLNKNDLFIKRLKNDRIPLQICFGDEFKYDYNGKQQDFKEYYQFAIHFIKQQYLAQIEDEEIKKNIKVHVTVATNKSNVEKVLKAVIAGIIKNTLKELEIIN